MFEKNWNFSKNGNAEMYVPRKKPREKASFTKKFPFCTVQSKILF